MHALLARIALPRAFLHSIIIIVQLLLLSPFQSDLQILLPGPIARCAIQTADIHC
jgi:hypothetical protein